MSTYYGVRATVRRTLTEAGGLDVNLVNNTTDNAPKIYEGLLVIAAGNVAVTLEHQESDGDTVILTPQVGVPMGGLRIRQVRSTGTTVGTPGTEIILLG